MVVKYTDDEKTYEIDISEILSIKIVAPNHLTPQSYVLSVFNGRRWKEVYRNEGPAFVMEMAEAIIYGLQDQADEKSL